MNPSIVSSLWLIPVLPLAAALLILLLPRPWRRTTVGFALAGQAGALVLSLVAFRETLVVPASRAVHNFTWFTFGDQTLPLGWMLDPLTAALLLMITVVSLCIFLFSIGYMGGDPNFTRFFAYLSFFTAAMLGVVVANSLLLLFICWELVGLASWLLIGFWIERPAAAAAAKKAFIITRLGDVGFFLGLLWLYHRSGTLLFYDNGAGCLEGASLMVLGGSATGIALLIFCGAAGKSGQFPLHTWLPDAMEGPTPVSALIHAATMVAAGVFLVARVYPLFLVGSVGNGVTTSLTVVVWVGVITGLLGALLALAQFDLKRVLAYSTISQLGLMMVSLGVGGVAAGIMHLLAHGFFKALLFLGAGSVIHGNHHEQDIRRLGGLRRFMPWTFAVYAIGMLALSGFPLLFAGAWTKEEILHATALWPVSRWPHYLMMAGVVLTALYMTRQMIFVFYGDARREESVPEESPWVMRLPLLFLAAATVALSALLTPAWPWLHHYLLGEPVHFEPANFFQPMLFISMVLVALGLFLGIWFYRGSGREDWLEATQPWLFRPLSRRFWIDELYAVTVVAVARGAARAADWLDRFVWGGLVRLVGGAGQLAGVIGKGVDDHAINARVDHGSELTRGLGRVISRLHSGRVQGYLAGLVFSALALLLLYAWWQ